MFSLIGRLATVATLTLAFAFPAVNAAPALAHTSKPTILKHNCAKLYHVVSAKRAINVYYAGRRHVSREESGLLDKFAKCQHSRGAIKYVNWYRGEKASDWRFRRNLTSYTVSGFTSSFGWPTEGVCGSDPGKACDITADGGNTGRPCIAMWQGQLGSHWWLTIGNHHATVTLCDRGPATWTGKTIDVTGSGLQAAGLSPYNYGNYWGSVTLLLH